jgi:hypothetical protein
MSDTAASLIDVTESALRSRPEISLTLLEVALSGVSARSAGANRNEPAASSSPAINRQNAIMNQCV